MENLADGPANNRRELRPDPQIGVRRSVGRETSFSETRLEARETNQLLAMAGIPRPAQEGFEPDTNGLAASCAHNGKWITSFAAIVASCLGDFG